MAWVGFAAVMVLCAWAVWFWTRQGPIPADFVARGNVLTVRHELDVAR